MSFNIDVLMHYTTASRKQYIANRHLFWSESGFGQIANLLAICSLYKNLGTGMDDLHIVLELSYNVGYYVDKILLCEISLDGRDSITHMFFEDEIDYNVREHDNEIEWLCFLTENKFNNFSIQLFFDHGIRIYRK